MPSTPEPSAEKDASASEPRNRYVNEDGVCWRQGCSLPATHLLTTRARPDETFPQGLLVEGGYCHEDAVWFAGAAVALYGGTFVSLTERDLGHGTTQPGA